MTCQEGSVVICNTATRTHQIAVGGVKNRGQAAGGDSGDISTLTERMRGKKRGYGATIGDAGHRNLKKAKNLSERMAHIEPGESFAQTRKPFLPNGDKIDEEYPSLDD